MIMAFRFISCFYLNDCSFTNTPDDKKIPYHHSPSFPPLALFFYQGPADPVTLGVHPDMLEAFFDMNSISTVLAVNYGILNITSLVAVPPHNYGPGIGDLGSFYSNPRFPTMIPIFCLTDVITTTTGRSVCYYQTINGNFLYPLATTKHRSCLS